MKKIAFKAKSKNKILKTFKNCCYTMQPISKSGSFLIYIWTFPRTILHQINAKIYPSNWYRSPRLELTTSQS